MGTSRDILFSDVLPLLLAGTIMIFLFSTFVVIIMVVQKRKQYKHLLEKERMQNSYQNQLLQTKLEVQEQSFKYLSEEIHDNILQELTSVKYQLHSMEYEARESDLKNKIMASSELLGNATGNLRNMSHTLNSAFIARNGIKAAIEKEAGYINSARQTKCVVQIHGKDYSLGAEKELLIFRIIQEALSNALKHAKPQLLDVVLDYKPGRLAVTIKDNGKGFDPTRKNNDGIGLNNMNIRAEMLKGKLEIQSEQDAGTTIHFEVANEE